MGMEEKKEKYPYAIEMISDRFIEQPLSRIYSGSQLGKEVKVNF